MVEVFKTDVSDHDQSLVLLDKIHSTFPDYQANFDLDDCDRILRVECLTASIHASLLINLLNDWGCNAAVLPGEALSSMIL